MFSNITDKIRLLFRKDKEPYLCFYKMLGFYPRNIEIYQQALLHKSSSIKAGKGRLLNNERLEFLGDAILDAIVADINALAGILDVDHHVLVVRRDAHVDRPVPL